MGRRAMLFLSFQVGLDLGALVVGLATLSITLYVLILQWRPGHVHLGLGYQAILVGYPDRLVVIVPLTMHNDGPQHVTLAVAQAHIQEQPLRWTATSRFIHVDAADAGMAPDKWTSIERVVRENLAAPVILGSLASDGKLIELSGSRLTAVDRSAITLRVAVAVAVGGHWPFRATTRREVIGRDFAATDEAVNLLLGRTSGTVELQSIAWP